jgi:hypothetical protein
MASDPVIYVADAGSFSKGTFHWVSSLNTGVSSSNPTQLASSIAEDMKNQTPVVLGYESPLFMPSEENVEQLGRARLGETDCETGSRPFNAGAGASVLATGLQSLAWVLHRIKQLHPCATATTRWQDFKDGKYQLFVWEAFVSGSEKAHPPSHMGDAALAISAFQQVMTGQDNPTRISNKNVFSLAGAAVIWAGLSSDLHVLSEPCVVLRPIYSKEEARQRLGDYRRRQAAASAEKKAKKRKADR